MKINSQVKKDEDLIGKSSGDTNFVSGSDYNLEDFQKDNQPDIELKLPMETYGAHGKVDLIHIRRNI